MSRFCNRNALKLFGLYSKKFNNITARNYCVQMNDSLDHATGLEKREICAMMAGNWDPFDMRVFKRAETSCKDSPNCIPSAFPERLVGCICEFDSSGISYMWLEKGKPKRCECGHWYLLIDKVPL